MKTWMQEGESNVAVWRNGYFLCGVMVEFEAVKDMRWPASIEEDEWTVM